MTAHFLIISLDMSFDNSDNNSEASASSSDEEQKNVEVSGFKLHIPRAKLEELIKEGLAIAPFLEVLFG